MATLAAYPEWYDRSGGIVPKQDITEVEVVRSYAPTGNEAAVWDASASLDGTVMAYIVGTKLTLVCDSLTEIPDKMFTYFISLERITGLSSVTVIGNLAFYRCHSLTSIDLIPENLTKIGDDAFRISNVEDVLDVSKLSAGVELGERVTRSQRWGDELAAVQSVWDNFNSGKICLHVPNPDSQTLPKYKEIPYATHENGDKLTLYSFGCRTFVCYHAWNVLYAGTDKEYADCEAWFNATLNKDGQYAESTIFNEESLKRDFETLGWGYPSDYWQSVTSASELEYILNELSNGFPVNATIKTSDMFHGVLIVGCDPTTQKLAFVDSGARQDRGAILWSAYEDLFIGGRVSGVDGSEALRKIDYKQPVLATSDSWFTQGGATVKRASITEIEIVNRYVPSGNETASWDASAKKNESVMAYVNGTKLTIAGNKPQDANCIYGFDCVYAHPDSSYAFGGNKGTDYFLNMSIFDGGNILNASKVRVMDFMFRNCINLRSIDVSNWDMSHVESTTCMFSSQSSVGAMKLSSLDVSEWDTSSLKNLDSMFQRCSALTHLDVSKWDVSSAKSLSTVFTSCTKLEEVDVSSWDTSACKDMLGIFQMCSSVRELNLSKWDTTICENMNLFFDGMSNLQKVVLGEKFSFNGNGTNTNTNTPAILPTPSSNYIPLADGNWYDSDLNAYTPADVPSNVARTYYASKFIAVGDDDEMVFVRNGTLKQIAFALRHKNGKTDTMYPSAFAEEVLAL